MEWNREKTIRKINILLETSSDLQIKYIDKLLGNAVAKEEFRVMQHKESRNFTKSDVPNADEDVEEGNWIE